MNIENMGNRSRGEYAYTIVDVNEVPTGATGSHSWGNGHDSCPAH